jgi:tetratricopeptide (TPR) repeat protein
MTNRSAGGPAFPIFLLAVLIFGLSALAYSRNGVWSGKVAMWEDVVRKSPRKARAHTNLGEAYHQQKQFDRAIEEYVLSLTLNPYYSLDAYSNLASIFVDRGEYDRAIEYFTRLLFVNSNDYLVYANRANAYALKGAHADAVRDYGVALALAPWDARLYARRGDLYLKTRDRASAAADFRTGCRLGGQDSCSRLLRIEGTGSAGG